MEATLRRVRIIFIAAMILTAALSFLAANIFAQGTPVPADTVVVQQINEEQLNLDLGTSFGSIGGLSALVLFCTAFLKKWLKTNNWITILLSGLLGIVLSATGFVFHLGIFDALEWYYIFIYGIVAAIIANGFSTYGIISAILTAVKLKVPKEK